MARGGVQKDDAVQHLRETLAAWVLREVSAHTEAQPDAAVRSDVVAAVQEAVAAAIDSKIQEFGEARSAVIAEQLRPEILAAFESLDAVFKARLDAMDAAWQEAVERHLERAETKIQQVALERYEGRFNRLIGEHTRRLESALRKVAADVQEGRPLDPSLTLEDVASSVPGEHQGALPDDRTPRHVGPARRQLGATSAWLSRPVLIGMLLLVVAVAGGLVGRCTSPVTLPQAGAETSTPTDARERAASDLRRGGAEADAQVGEAQTPQATGEATQDSTGEGGRPAGQVGPVEESAP